MRHQLQTAAAILAESIDPRPAEYRGVRMRSQLEADFAKHLDNLGARDWRYEPKRYVGTNGVTYLPDFQVGHKFFEIKPTRAEVRAAAERMTVIWDTEPDALLTVVCAEGSRFHTARRGEGWVSFVERWGHD